jgi:hypothetical protein
MLSTGGECRFQIEGQHRLPDKLQAAGNDLRYDDELIERRPHATTNLFELRNNVIPRKQPKLASFPETDVTNTVTQGVIHMLPRALSNRKAS